jgi:decaprenyl-phosphate phosphoribosyltransferase
VTSRLRVAGVSRAPAPDLALYPGWLRWPLAVLRTARPRQWPKNLLVFAAPLAGASLGRDDGLGYALVAAVAFCAASVAVYMVNDVVDADRDRRHPVKRTRPVAAGILPKSHALAIGAVCAMAALAAGLAINVPLLSAILAAYLVSSLLYSLVLKHIPVIELVFVASGFVLRALGGAAATHVPPSGWFLLVCSLGAFLVATAKRYTEMVVLGADAVRHRPSTRWYRLGALRLTQRMTAIAMIIAYLLWALGEHGVWIRGWHLASALPLAATLVRFDYLTAQASPRPVEDLLARDAVMVVLESVWLLMFVAGLWELIPWG